MSSWGPGVSCEVGRVLSDGPDFFERSGDAQIRHRRPVWAGRQGSSITLERKDASKEDAFGRHSVVVMIEAGSEPEAATRSDCRSFKMLIHYGAVESAEIRSVLDSATKPAEKRISQAGSSLRIGGIQP